MIATLWYDFESFWHGKNQTKSSTTALSSWLQADTYQGFSKRYHKSILVKVYQSYKGAKLAVKKKLRHFGFEATFYVVVHGRILAKIHEFKVDKLWAPTALLPLDIKKPKVPHLKFQLLSTWSLRISSLVAILRHFMLIQNTPKSYHNMRIDREWLKGAVNFSWANWHRNGELSKAF